MIMIETCVTSYTKLCGQCDRSCTLSRLKNLNDIEMGLGSSFSSEREIINILQLFLLCCAKKAHQGKPMKPVLPREAIAKNVRVTHHIYTHVAVCKCFLTIFFPPCLEFYGNVDMDSAENEFPNGTWNKHSGGGK